MKFLAKAKDQLITDDLDIADDTADAADGDSTGNNDGRKKRRIAMDL